VTFVKIMDGNTFAISDGNGDIYPTSATPTGLFAFDTRFLSKWRLSLNGAPLHALAADDISYFETRFFLVPGRPTHYIDAKLSVIRQRSVGGGFEERLTIINHDEVPVELTVLVEAASDFADLLEIKEARTKQGKHYTRIEGGCLRLGYEREKFRRETLVSATMQPQIDERGLTFTVHIVPDDEWSTELRVETLMLGTDGRDVREKLYRRRRTKPQIQQDLNEWLDHAPKLACDDDPLTRTYQRSLIDLAALRISPLSFPDVTLPAGGVPWSMTLVGRESIITSLQTLPFAPELAATTMRVLGIVQGSKLDDFRDEEPGKIMREFRYGESAAFEEHSESPYYGAADCTPLYLILMDEYERWTGDTGLVRDYEQEGRQALRWIDEYGDLRGDGYLWYQSRNRQTGRENQCWKESPDAISYRDGRLPRLPRATCELQGYAYDAKLRGARLARLVWGDPDLADRLEREAAELKERFNRDFWIEDGEYYALALDGDGNKVDALSSNIGHLLWSGIVDESRAGQVASHLVGPELFSGWGVRTLGTRERRYNPISYHVGSVSPFDNSFIAWGLRRYGFEAEAGRIAEGLIDAAEFFDGRLPEAFGGYDRELTKYPVPYPSACSPHAWCSGAPLLLLRTMLGLDPHGDQLVVNPALPSHIGQLELLDIPGRWGRRDAFGRGRRLGA
jgi:glycogen debranching enzyme